MKSVVLFSTLLFSLSLFADGKFDEHKKNFIEHLTDHSAVIQKATDCANAAQDEKALKKCGETFRKEIKNLKEKAIDKKIKKLEKEKENMENKKN